MLAQSGGLLLASSDATSQHVPEKSDKPSREAAQSCKDSVRNPG
jgi:hypothetical protein